jgi:polyphosphate kinase
MKELIEREIEFAKKGEKAHIIIKVNSLVDKAIIKHLYKASQAGVKIDLLVRGVCCLRPGLEGISENIQVTSIVGRFLEHSRIYYFLNGGQEQVFLGSADLMPRNIDRRVEVLFPVEESRLIRQLHDNVLDIYLRDTVKARRMNPDGSYVRVVPESPDALLNSQEWLIKNHLALAKE